MPFRRAVLLTLAVLLSSQVHVRPSFAVPDVVNTYVTIPGLGMWGLAFDSAGYLYVSGILAGVQGVWKVAPGGASYAPFVTGMANPKGLAFDSSGDLYVADWGNGASIPAKIWKVTPAGVKSVFASMASPTDLAFDNSGNLLASGWGTHKVYKVTPAGVVSDYATNIAGPLDEIGGVAYDAATGDLYVAAQSFIKKIGPGGSPVTSVATTATIVGLARGPQGQFWLSRYSHSDLYSVEPGGVSASLWSGAHLDNACTNGPLLTARFSLPAGLLFHNDVLYIADAGCHMVRSAIPGLVPTIATSWGRVKSIYR